MEDAPVLDQASAALVDAEPSAHVNSLSDDLQAVLEHAAGNAVTVGELTDVLRERGLAMVLIVITFPFLIPIPTMGLSAPVGLAVVIYGACVALNVKPWLPGLLARRQISYAMLKKAIGFACRWVRLAEKLLKPRLKFMLWPGINIPIGLSLIFCGVFMSLPLPIPFTNAIPALAILLLLAGLIERDGVFVLAGQVIALGLLGACGVVLYLIGRYGWQGVRSMMGMDEPSAGPSAAPSAAASAPGTAAPR